MILSYKQKVTKINNAAKYLAAFGYHVTTSFLSSRGTMEVTVYFKREEAKDSIENHLHQYEDEHDRIVFNEFENEDHSKFYTLTLYKDPS